MSKLVMQFVGTGAGEGVPTPFCRCKVCENARKVGGKEVRFRSCFRVSEGLMIDMGPDILAECVRNGIDLYDLEHLLITHTHEDHFNIFNFFLKPMISGGNGKKLHVYLTGDSYKIIDTFNNMEFSGRKNFFKEELSDHIEFHQLSFWKEFNIDGCKVIPIKGSHQAHFEKNSSNFYIILPNGQTMVYALDTGYYCEETLSFLKDKQLDFFIVEGTFGSAKRGDMPYSHLDLHSSSYLCNVLYEQNTITDNTKVFITHLNQEQEYTHEDMCEYFENHKTTYEIKVAYDGLKIDYLLR